jgi:hypothetical protein
VHQTTFLSEMRRMATSTLIVRFDSSIGSIGSPGLHLTSPLPRDKHEVSGRSILHSNGNAGAVENKRCPLSGAFNNPFQRACELVSGRSVTCLT